jgi:hypothetical protein
MSLVLLGGSQAAWQLSLSQKACVVSDVGGSNEMPSGIHTETLPTSSACLRVSFGTLRRLASNLLTSEWVAAA